MKKIINSKSVRFLSIGTLVFIISTGTVLALKGPEILNLKLKEMVIPKEEINLELKEMVIPKEESDKNLKNGIEYTKNAKKEIETVKQFEKEKKEKIQKENNTADKLENKKETNTIVTNRAVDDKIKENLPKDKKETLEKLEEKGKQKIGTYTRKTNEILGKINKSSKRISLADAKKIITTKDFKAAINEITNINQYPDFEGGSGVTINEYWLNDEGTELILCIVEQSQFYYQKMNNNFEIEFTEKLTK